MAPQRGRICLRFGAYRNLESKMKQQLYQVDYISVSLAKATRQMYRLIVSHLLVTLWQGSILYFRYRFFPCRLDG